MAVVGGEVGTLVGVVVDTVVEEVSIAGAVVVGVQHREASVAGAGDSRIGLSVSWDTRAHQYLHHTRCTYHLLAGVAAASLAVAQKGMLGGWGSLLLVAFELVGDRAGQNKSRGGVVVVVVIVVAVVIADTHTDHEKDSDAEEGALVSSSVPCLGSTCLDLDCVFDEGE